MAQAKLHPGSSMELACQDALELDAVDRPSQFMEPGLRQRLCLYFQPIEPLGSQGASGSFEVLLRVLNHDGTVERPCSLIAELERQGRGGLLDRLVIDMCLDWLQSHATRLADGQHCFVNLTADSLADGRWVRGVMKRLQRDAIPAGKLCFEISERATPQRLSSSVDVIHALQDLGCMVALDDFGKSNASFHSLRTIPCNFIKIDGDLVRGMVSSAVDRNIVAAITSLGHSLDKTMIGECVESGSIRAMLMQLGVELGQGFHLAMPRPMCPAGSGTH